MSDTSKRGEKRERQQAICKSKRVWNTRKKARAVAKRDGLRLRAAFRVYRCPVCDLYHVTTQPHDMQWSGIEKRFVPV